MPNEPQIIDQRPQERRAGGPTIWWIASAIVLLLWVAQIALDGWAKWDQIALGAGTAILLTIWGIEMSDNKLPLWMVPPRRDRRIPK